MSDSQKTEVISALPEVKRSSDTICKGLVFRFTINTYGDRCNSEVTEVRRLRLLRRESCVNGCMGNPCDHYFWEDFESADLVSDGYFDMSKLKHGKKYKVIWVDDTYNGPEVPSSEVDGYYDLMELTP